MAHFLEAVMLICFGISWPISLMKNIKARSAKSMSIHFILMIIIGYIAGIAAKCITHNYNYVLIIYFCNLIVVSINLIVYFINRQHDREAEAAAQKHDLDLTTHPRVYEITTQEHIYKEMNTMVPQGGIVFFGSDLFAQLPAEELTKTFGLHETVLNRSIGNITIDALSEALESCVLDLKPDKVFLNIGDADLKKPEFDLNDFAAKFDWLLYTIHTKTNASIYVVSIVSDTAQAKALNAKLKDIAADSGIEYIDAACVIGSEKPHIRLFDLLKFYIRSHPISFCEAMTAEAV